MYTVKTETFMAVVWCYLFTRTSHICPSQNSKTTWSQFELSVYKKKRLIMWPVDIGNLAALEKTFNCSEISLTISRSSKMLIDIMNDHGFEQLVHFSFLILYFPTRIKIHLDLFNYFPFGFGGRIWDLIVSVPDHCLIFYFLLFTSLPGQFQDFHSPDRLRDHDVVAGTLKESCHPSI